MKRQTDGSAKRRNSVLFSFKIRTFFETVESNSREIKTGLVTNG